jgi:hypothetical protein
MIDWEGFAYNTTAKEVTVELEIHIEIDKDDTGTIVYDIEVWDDESLCHDDNYSYYGCTTLEQARVKLQEIVSNHQEVKWKIVEENLVGWWE